MDKIKYIINLVIVFLMILTVAVNRDGKIMGYNADELVAKQENSLTPAMRTLADGSVVLNSSGLIKDVSGYGGPVPVEIHLVNGVIATIRLLPNSETPDFQERVIEKGLIERWNGMTPDEAAKSEIDVVSGATLTSEAVITTVRRLSGYAASVYTETKRQLPLRSIIAFAVILFGVVMAILRPKNKKLRIILLMLNISVLGFWCASFLSLSLFINWASYGVNLTIAAVPFVLFIISVIMPLTGRKNHYCTYHCPMGALQELASKTTKKRIKISPAILMYASILREGILFGLLFVMWAGMGFELINYEVFTAFVFSSASSVILIAGVVFTVLAIVTDRPYCRFVCPTGCLLRFSQDNK